MQALEELAVEGETALHRRHHEGRRIPKTCMSMPALSRDGKIPRFVFAKLRSEQGYTMEARCVALRVVCAAIEVKPEMVAEWVQHYGLIAALAGPVRKVISI